MDSSSILRIARDENCVHEKLCCGTVLKKLEFKEKSTKLLETVIGFEQNLIWEIFIASGK